VDGVPNGTVPMQRIDVETASTTRPIPTPPRRRHPYRPGLYLFLVGVALFVVIAAVRDADAPDTALNETLAGVGLLGLLLCLVAVCYWIYALIRRAPGARQPVNRSAASKAALRRAWLVAAGALIAFVIGSAVWELQPATRWVAPLSIAVIFWLARVAQRQWVRATELNAGTPQPPDAAPVASNARSHPGRGGLYLALAAVGCYFVFIMIEMAVLGPDVDLTRGTVGYTVNGIVGAILLCVCILGLSYWGYAHSSRMVERRLQRDLGGAPRLFPSEDEEAALDAAIAVTVWNERTRWTFTLLLTDVRQKEMTLPIGLTEARELSRRAIDAVGGHVLDDDENLLRGWWPVGSPLNGCPVVVAFSFEANTEGTTSVAVRAISKYWLLNRTIAPRSLDRVVRALGDRLVIPPVPV
jgi:cbb3-type cytochrome oxidase subunit 3